MISRLATDGLEQLVADTLGMARGEVTDATEFRGVPEWDSLGHVELMLALEQHWGIEIDAGLVTRLTSVAAIRAFAERASGSANRGGAGGRDRRLERGLGEVYLDETHVSSIDGEAGRLTYRGYDIDDLVASASFEETAFLLLGGRLPTATELADFERRLGSAVDLPDGVRRVVAGMADARPVDALRTGLAALGAYDVLPPGDDPLDLGSRLIGRVAALVIEHAAGRGGPAVETDGRFGLAGRLLWSVTGRRPSDEAARAFDRCLVLLAEHGSNASTFAGRVATGTHADAYAALTAALSTFAGPLHGGAIEAVRGMVDQIGEPARAAEWLAGQRARRQPIYGFGHRIYRTEDPRAPHLRRMAEELSRSDDDRRALAVVEELRRLMADRARHGVDVNVDLYAGLVLARLGLPPESFVPVFAASRTAGWVAHIVEQQHNNVLIRPRLRYTGETRRTWLPIAERGPAPIEVVASVVPEAALPERRLHSGFVDNAARAPHALALRLGDRTYSYGELDQIARRWAGAILDAAGGQPRRVGVYGLRSEVTYAGSLAALMSGAAFVPLSPELPIARTRRMIEAARLDALLVDGRAAPQLGEVLDGGSSPVVLAPEPASQVAHGFRVRDASSLATVPPLADLPAVAADATAYLMFTSGSTGTPKGVPISHANVAHFLEVNLARYGLSPDDRLSQTFQQTFDLSVFDLFMAWSSGAGLCVPQAIDLLSPFGYVERNGISIWFSVPSLATLLLRQGLLRRGVLPSLRWSLFCGEALPRTTAEAWQAAAPQSHLENLYGPTECTIACTAYRWHPERSPAECLNEIVPIGRPWAGVEAHVVDERGQPVEPGQAGELAVGGRQTFGGYWDAPAATERAFLESGAARLYRTGDRVTTLDSGEIAFVGRLDQQVQVLGHRVELGEVEAVLRARPGVTDAVAVPWHASAASAEGLTAFVSGVGLEVDALAAALRAQLPPYMAPRTILVLDEMPRNASGKIDRRALQAMADR